MHRTQRHNGQRGDYDEDEANSGRCDSQDASLRNKKRLRTFTSLTAASDVTDDASTGHRYVTIDNTVSWSCCAVLLARQLHYITH